MSKHLPALERAIIEQCQQAKLAADILSLLSEKEKNHALNEIHIALAAEKSRILEVNAEEVEQAKLNNIDPAFLDRMQLTSERFSALLTGIERIIQLPDPVGRELASWSVPSGLNITRTAIPLGVIGVIYESRPNVTADAAVLCLKSGNAVVLRGGSECVQTNQLMTATIQTGLIQAGISPHTIQYVLDQSYAALDILLRMDDTIDVLIPRGGLKLMRKIKEQSRIPVFSHLSGLCHTYIHKEADPEMAVAVTANAKMRRTGICGATETLLLDRSIAPFLLPGIVAVLIDQGCEVRGDAQARAIDSRIGSANEQDWSTEYLDAVLSIKTVDSIEEAIIHIQDYGSGHTDAIITDNEQAAAQFLQQVSSANVMHNCSTQFADGGEFGLGAEIGIATGKLHARGPVGLEQLTTFKYQVKGTGQIRS